MNDTNAIPNEVLEAREKYVSIDIHCPHLDKKTMNPFPELSFNSKCPLNKDGRCGDCESFVGFWTPNGTVFSYGKFEGFCDSKT